MLQNTINFWGDVLSVNIHWAVSSVSQSDVENSPVLCDIDMFSGEHLVSEFLNVGLSGQVEQFGENLLIDQVLGKVEKHFRPVKVLESVTELGGSGWILLESLFGRKVFPFDL